MTKPNVLVLSFSPIYRDARVLREIEALARVSSVTTIGYGARPEHTVEHVVIPDNAPSLPQTIPGVAKLALRLHSAVELAAPGAQAVIKLCEKQLAGKRFDLVVANDARAIPLAFKLADGAPVWADLHEYAPEERTHVTSWRLLVAPLMHHICKKYLPRCAATTTVGEEIAKLYEQNYGVRPQLLRNVGPLRVLEPTPVDPSGPIRLVHSGAAVYGRNLEATIEAVAKAGEGYTLDLYLVQANDGGKYFRQLQEVAQGCPRIRFQDPVEPSALPRTLNGYDMGVFWIPPFNTNARLTLPNKIFDYIQARIAIAVGPTVEMQRIVNHYQLGVVSNENTVEAISETLRELTPEKIQDWKENTRKAAAELNFERESEVIIDIVRTLTR